MIHLRRGFLVFAFVLLAISAQASNRITYTSQPDELLIFLNDIAFATDSLILPTGMEAAVTLPAQVYPDTIVLRENGERVSSYRLRTTGGQTVVTWESAAEGDLREVTLDYLIGGIRWQPKYDMWLTRGEEEAVELDFFAEIYNPSLTLDEVTVTLAAGRVDTANTVSMRTQITANQIIAGYAEGSLDQLGVGAVDIQTLYPIGTLDSEPGETIYLSIAQGTLPARRVLLWNAQTDNQVGVIYKVRNTFELPIAEGIVRAYENGVFLGSDHVEATPIGSEGSITVGALQSIRVSRSETRESLSGFITTWRTDVELTANNFTTEPIDIEIVDSYPTDARNFTFSQEAERQIGNLLRWQVTLQPGEELRISYSYEH